MIESENPAVDQKVGSWVFIDFSSYYINPIHQITTSDQNNQSR